MNARSWPICESTGWLEKRLMLNMIEVIMGFDNKWNLLKKVVNGFLFLLVYYLFVCYILQIIYKFVLFVNITLLNKPNHIYFVYCL